MSDRAINVNVGDGAYMALPKPDWIYQLAHVRKEPDRGTKCDDRMLVVGVLESYLYLVENCTKDEAWSRIKLMRSAMKALRSTDTEEATK